MSAARILVARPPQGPDWEAELTALLEKEMARYVDETPLKVAIHMNPCRSQKMASAFAWESPLSGVIWWNLSCCATWCRMLFFSA